MHFRSIFPFFGPKRGKNARFAVFWHINAEEEPKNMLKSMKTELIIKTNVFMLRLSFSALSFSLSFFANVLNKKEKYWPEMHCALVYFYSGLMFLICTYINFHCFYIVGFSEAFICQNTANLAFLPPPPPTPRFGPKREILTGNALCIDVFLQ